MARLLVFQRGRSTLDNSTTTRENAESRFAALLTAEQLEKWENFKELRKGRRGARRGGHGGPFGAGFGDGFGPPEQTGPIG